MRILPLSAAGLLAVVLSILPNVAFADAVALAPAVQIATPGCGIIDNFCAINVTNITTSSGTFSLNIQAPPQPIIQSDNTGTSSCFDFSGSAALDATTFALTSDPTHRLCLSQPVDANFFPVPPTGPWPLEIDAVVDGDTSNILTVQGTWIPTSSCLDPNNQPIQLCGFSGEELTFALTSVSLPTPPCTVGCPPPCTVDCPSPGATPELDSLALFGTGLLSGLSYLGLRRRARKL